MEKLNKEIEKEVDESMENAEVVTHHMLLHKLHKQLKEDGYNITQPVLWKYFNMFADDIVNALEDGKTVKLAKLVEFKYQDRSPRSARNPQTGEPIAVPAKKVVKVRPLSEIAKLTKIIEE